MFFMCRKWNKFNDKNGFTMLYIMPWIIIKLIYEF